MSKTTISVVTVVFTAYLVSLVLAGDRMSIRSVDFEVFGRVQGVFFRKNTVQQANQLGLKGWCMNTSNGTVKGSVQGPADKVDEMMNWLRTKGSPSSVIEKAEFTNDKNIPDFTYKKFDVVKE